MHTKFEQKNLELYAEPVSTMYINVIIQVNYKLFIIISKYMYHQHHINRNKSTAGHIYIITYTYMHSK